MEIDYSQLINALSPAEALPTTGEQEESQCFSYSYLWERSLIGTGNVPFKLITTYGTRKFIGDLTIKPDYEDLVPAKDAELRAIYQLAGETFTCNTTLSSKEAFDAFKTYLDTQDVKLIGFWHTPKYMPTFWRGDLN